jgi:hypothetical protein
MHSENRLTTRLAVGIFASAVAVTLVLIEHGDGRRVALARPG